MTILILSLLIGVMAGLRAVTAPAAVAWAAHLGWLKLAGTPLAFMGHVAAPWILTVLALGELIGDQLALDAEPQGAGAVRHPRRHRRAVRGGAGGAGRPARRSAGSPAPSARCSARSAARRRGRSWPRPSAATCRRP